MAGLTRLELATFRVTGGRSNQLSYSPINFSIPHSWFQCGTAKQLHLA